jgi:dihydropteroate synthase
MTNTMFHWRVRDRVLTPGSPPLVMGIVNVTPDSFSDGGRFLDAEAAIAHGLRLVAEGADLLDIGGESSRPGAESIALDEELRRVLPVVTELAARTAVPLSIDTTKADVARQTLAAGAHLVNDITALQSDPAMAEVVRSSGAGVILMHMQGTPATMQVNPTYGDVVGEVGDFLKARLQALIDVGIAAEQVVLDPGIGFGKKSAHNWALLARLEELQRLGRPVCLGISRKGFLGHRLDRPLEQRLAGSLAAACFALGRGAAQVLRVHDVAATHDAVQVYQALSCSPATAPGPP